jgi:serine/threonine protein phosphatase PrpC
MSRVLTHVEVRARRGTGQDRAEVVEIDGGVVIVLADGAGGTSHGDRAADAVVEAVRCSDQGDRGQVPWGELLGHLDRVVSGETTAVIVAVTDDGITGASVGDSAAWVVRGADIDDLTAYQEPKPLVGSGHAIPLAFVAGGLGDGTLVVASDGVMKYAKRADIARVARGPDLATAAAELVALVRLPSGELQDDVSIVLCRSAQR